MFVNTNTCFQPYHCTFTAKYYNISPVQSTHCKYAIEKSEKSEALLMPCKTIVTPSFYFVTYIRLTFIYSHTLLHYRQTCPCPFTHAFTIKCIHSRTQTKLTFIDSVLLSFCPSVLLTCSMDRYIYRDDKSAQCPSNVTFQKKANTTYINPFL